MSAGSLRYNRLAERPDIELWLLDDDGNLINFNTPAYTFTWKIGEDGVTAVFTKSSGITGAAGAGVEPSGTPNVVLTFTAGELANVPAGRYKWQLTATTSALDRVFKGRITVEEAIL
jgi:hypothetical protein